MTKIGVPAAKGRLIAASAISSSVKKLAAAPTATAPVVNFKNFLREIVSITGS